MGHYKQLEGHLVIQDARVGIVLSRFNDFIGERLLAGALDGLERHGLAREAVEVCRVPGAFELPLAAKALAERGGYDGLVALGCVIRGATPHFGYVAGECVKGLSHVSLQFDLPVGMGVLTVDSIEQAIERAGSKAGNKGFEAAVTVIEMIALLRRLRAD